MVELVEVLHVAEDDVFFVDDPWRNLLHPTGHLPQVRLERKRQRETETKTEREREGEHAYIHCIYIYIYIPHIMHNASHLVFKVQLTSMHSRRSRT